MGKKRPSEERFWEKVDVAGPDGCWEWIAFKTRKGYGMFDGYRAHRFAWLLTNGLVPESIFVLHKCDNRCCVNPNHLFLGTAKDNAVDMIQKGRWNTGKKSKKYLILTPDQEKIECTSLKDFAKERGLSYEAFRDLSKGRVKHHMGYKILEKDDKPFKSKWIP